MSKNHSCRFCGNNGWLEGRMYSHIANCCVSSMFACGHCGLGHIWEKIPRKTVSEIEKLGYVVVGTNGMVAEDERDTRMIDDHADGDT